MIKSEKWTALVRAVGTVVQQIYSDACCSENAELLEMAVDAGRLESFGFPTEQEYLRAQIGAFGYGWIMETLGAEPSLNFI